MDVSTYRSKGNVLLTGIVMIAMGVIILINPIQAMDTIVRMIGCALIVFGILALVPAFIHRDTITGVTPDIGSSILAIIFGLVLAFFPTFVVTVVWTMIGIFILLTGILDIVEARPLRQTAGMLGLLATGSGVLCVLLGILVICVPMASPTLGMLVAAGALIINGITEIIFALGR